MCVLCVLMYLWVDSMEYHVLHLIPHTRYIKLFLESLRMIRQARAPFIVALNKIDKPNSNVDMVKACNLKFSAFCQASDSQLGQIIFYNHHMYALQLRAYLRKA